MGVAADLRRDGGGRGDGNRGEEETENVGVRRCSPYLEEESHDCGRVRTDAGRGMEDSFQEGVEDDDAVRHSEEKMGDNASQNRTRSQIPEFVGSGRMSPLSELHRRRQVCKPWLLVSFLPPLGVKTLVVQTPPASCTLLFPCPLVCPRWSTQGSLQNAKLSLFHLCDEFSFPNLVV